MKKVISKFLGIPEKVEMILLFVCIIGVWANVWTQIMATLILLALSAKKLTA